MSTNINPIIYYFNDVQIWYKSKIWCDINLPNTEFKFKLNLHENTDIIYNGEFYLWYAVFSCMADYQWFLICHMHLNV